MGGLPANSKQNLRCDLKELTSVTTNTLVLGCSFRKDEVSTLDSVSPINYSYKTQNACSNNWRTQIKLEQVDWRRPEFKMPFFAALYSQNSRHPDNGCERECKEKKPCSSRSRSRKESLSPQKEEENAFLYFLLQKPRVLLYIAMNSFKITQK